MILSEMIDLLNNDLKNEWKHLCFYLATASRLTGLHAHEYKELFLKSAAGEMEHVKEFQDLIIGLGGVPTTEVAPFTPEENVIAAIRAATVMEKEVVANYIQRQKDAQLLALADPINGGWVDVFLDAQIQDSRQDADHYMQILRGVPKPTDTFI